MADTAVQSNNLKVAFKGKPTRERDPDIDTAPARSPKKKINRLRKAGKISDRMHAQKTSQYDPADDSYEQESPL